LDTSQSNLRHPSSLLVWFTAHPRNYLSNGVSRGVYQFIVTNLKKCGIYLGWERVNKFSLLKMHYICHTTSWLLMKTSSKQSKHCDPHQSDNIVWQATNPLRPNSDQHQISPCNINAQLSEQVLRIKGMITKDELFWYLNNLSQLALQQMYGN